jgi:nucleoside-diphosphate-sugar epimerase
MTEKTKIDLTGKTVLVTGAAGFIGANLCKRLLSEIKDISIFGLDSVNAYYDVRIKEYRLNELSSHDNFTFVKGNLADKALVTKLFQDHKFQIVVNLAAQAGVRYASPIPMPT